MGATDRYCLRWNNHKTNFVSVLDDLLENQTLTDVTLGVEDGPFLKCHKIILATCSPYFRSIFIDETLCSHPIVLLKDVKYTEIKAILDFMYKGEVSVARDEMGALLEVAELLKVKGLVADSELSSASEPTRSPSSSVRGTTSDKRIDENPRSSDNVRSTTARRHSTSSALSASVKSPKHQNVRDDKFSMPAWPMTPQFLPTDEPKPVPGLTGFHPFLPQQSFPFSHCDNVIEPTPAKHSRKRTSGNNNVTRHHDIPILRTILKPDHQDDASMIPRDSDDSHFIRNRSNGSSNNDAIERRSSMDLSQSYGPHCHYETDAAIINEEEKRTIPQSFTGDTKAGNANYGSSQKQEVKRYKKYSSDALWNAIESVKGGLSANKASELFNIPSRTLYDKIKKLGVAAMKSRRAENPRSASGSLDDIVGGPMTSGMCEKILKNENDNVGESMENPRTIVETTFNENRGGTNDDAETMDFSRTCSSVHRDNSPTDRPPDETSFRNNENEAEDLTVSRRANVRVIVSPNIEIKEIA